MDLLAQADVFQASGLPVESFSTLSGFLPTSNRCMRSKRQRRRAGVIMKWRRAMKIAGPSKDERMALLKHWANVRVRTDDNYGDRRLAYNRIQKRPDFGPCWVCGQMALLVKHHVVQLQNGGHSWELNIIKICDPCHCEIHPWLRPLETVGKLTQTERSQDVSRHLVTDDNLARGCEWIRARVRRMIPHSE